MITLYINENKKMGHINPEIYGHFSEHLGRCIYEGLYVGENSEIPNVNGMRTDEAVENILNMFARTRNNQEYIHMVKKNRIV